MQRNRGRLIEAKEGMRFGKISGAVGTYAHIPPELELIVCKKLKLKSPDISNQILQRDRHAEFITTLAIIGSSLEKIATEIRHLARTEVHEVEEPFTEKQKGSSCMPQKRNPIGSENTCGCSRVLRGYALAAMENITLWHERDISHSSAERIIFPDATILLYHMITKTINVIENMKVYPENMKRNMEISPSVYLAQKVLLMLTDEGMSRETAYRIVQKCSMESMDTRQNFVDVVIKNRLIYETLKEDDLKFLVSYSENYVKNVVYIFDRVFGEN
jgi:adenylosuccinate lyase